MAWPTNIQSGTPDGQFGPAKIMATWGDCWFLAVLAAVANSKEGHAILAESIKEVDGGYEVTFKALPNNNLFISDAELQALLKTQGGDADTRLMELAADKFFNKRGNFKSLFIAAAMSIGMNEEQAKQCLQDFCRAESIPDSMTHNPMRAIGNDIIAFFLFTGMRTDVLQANHFNTLHSSDILAYRNRYVTNNHDGASVTINTEVNPLGESFASHDLMLWWDVIRTEITSTSPLSEEQQAFLKSLGKWLGSTMPNDLQALKSAAKNLKLKRMNPEDFVDTLIPNLSNMNPEHVDLLRSGVQEVLADGPGFIGLCGQHVGTIEGIDEAAGTFTYCEPNFPELVHR